MSLEVDLRLRLPELVNLKAKLRGSEGIARVEKEVCTLLGQDV